MRGDIDLYPEYTGTALSTILKLPPAHHPAEALALVRNEYQSRFSLQWMDPLGFNNTFAMVIGGDEARTHKIATLSEAAGICSRVDSRRGVRIPAAAGWTGRLTQDLSYSSSGFAEDHGPRLAVQGA